MNTHHLAQVNIGKGKGGMDSVIMQGFSSRLDEMNALAEQVPGFVWRLKGEGGGDATSIQAYDDPNIIVNMSVWEDVESLKHYVYKTAHVEMLKNKKLWFDKLGDVHQVLWWIPAGHIPTIEEAKAKLNLCRQQGPTPDAFNFAKPFAAPVAETL